MEECSIKKAKYLVALMPRIKIEAKSSAMLILDGKTKVPARHKQTEEEFAPKTKDEVPSGQGVQDPGVSPYVPAGHREH